MLQQSRPACPFMLPIEVVEILSGHRWRWLVTGAAGFIGSNIVDALIENGQDVLGLDNFSTGHKRNLEGAQHVDTGHHRGNFELVEGDIRDRDACELAVKNVDYVLHQAAIGSVPWSLADPLTAHDVNVTGMLNLLDAARRARIRRFIYAASSATYGDNARMPKREDDIGSPLSPYAATKLVNEIYAGIFARCYGFRATGLRYFNVFGPRQDPNGPYAAVIPKWISAMVQQDEITVNGDGQTSRDFCYVANVVQANIRAVLAPDGFQGDIYNIAVGQQTTLLELFGLIRESLAERQIVYSQEPKFGEFRAGDVRHSLADISKARRQLSFDPTHSTSEGLAAAMPWYIENFGCQPNADQ